MRGIKISARSVKGAGLLAIGTGLFILLNGLACFAQPDYTEFVNRFIGTGANGAVSPVAAVPFGMVQAGPNTFTRGSGYHYDAKEILGFSQVNKSGGGCSDFLDVLFVPIDGSRWNQSDRIYPAGGFPSPFSHREEEARPGYYKVQLQNVKAEITATARCGFHKYTFDERSRNFLAIDLEHGSRGACTIVPEDNKEEIISSGMRIVDSVTVEGWRVTSGWADEQHVYFHARFSIPISDHQGFESRKRVEWDGDISGSDIRAILGFNIPDDKELLVKVGISPVSCEGARRNLDREIPGWDFESTRVAASDLWNNELSKIDITASSQDQKIMFYTALHNTLLYPMLYSDVNNQFRGPDHKVHVTDGFSYYGGVVGVWDTFRAATPLLTFLRPDIARDYVKTFLEHYRYFGQLPVWVLAGNETFQMLGMHTLPIITDCYLRGIVNEDISELYKAMKVSAMKDTIGYSMRYFVGLVNYKTYGFVPADLEAEATARTLEYAFDDWCVARMAEALGHREDHEYFLQRSKNYQNVFDPEIGFMNGRFSDGRFRRPLDPFRSTHRRDDYCEGNAWQWSFFVPHDVEGLAALYGGKEQLSAKLDALFSVSSELTGSNVSGDISGLIGQYAHGNEPSHHVPYMFNRLGQPWKSQKLVNQILTTLYENSPTGLCGNDDTGQMSAWYAFSAMGLYPLNPASQEYEIGSPLFRKSVIKLVNGAEFTIKARKLSEANIYVQSAKLNGKPLENLVVNYSQIIQGGTLELTMGKKPNKVFGFNRQ